MNLTLFKMSTTISRLSTNQLPVFIKKNCFNYVKQKDIDDILKDYSQSQRQKIKYQVNLKKYGFILYEGLKQATEDCKIYANIRKKQIFSISPVSQSQLIVENRVNQQFQKIKLLIILKFFPFSNILILSYLYTYPLAIPSWFLIDAYIDQWQQNCIQKQTEAIQYYRVNALNEGQFHQSKLSLQQLKRLSNLLYGFYDDGVGGFNRILKSNKKYLIFSEISKFLIIKSIRKCLQKQDKYKELAHLNLNQKIIWKYRKVMKGQDILIFQSICQSTHTNIQQMGKTQNESQPIVNNQTNKDK